MLIFLLCKVLVTKEKRKWKHVESKPPTANGGTELQEIVSKENKELQNASPDSSASAPPLLEPDEQEGQNGEKEKKKQNKLPGEDFYSGKDTLETPHLHAHAHAPWEDDDDDDDGAGLKKLIMGGDDESFFVHH
jgi:hypothetical protein